MFSLRINLFLTTINFQYIKEKLTTMYKKKKKKSKPDWLQLLVIIIRSLATYQWILRCRATIKEGPSNANVLYFFMVGHTGLGKSGGWGGGGTEPISNNTSNSNQTICVKWNLHGFFVLGAIYRRLLVQTIFFQLWLTTLSNF